MRRVVVSGLGILSPLGRGLKCNWNGIVQALPCIKKVESFDISAYSSQIAGTVPRTDKLNQQDGSFNPLDVFSEKELRRIDDFIAYGITAGEDAIEDSGFLTDDEYEKQRTGVIIGSGIGGINTIFHTSLLLNEKGPRKVSPFFIPSCISNMAAGHLSIKYGFKGPNSATAVACATSAYTVQDAARIIMTDDADIMIAGGAEAAVNPLAFSGFSSARALSSHYNDTPELASRPYDKGRDGFVIGEGAGVLVLEEMEHAKKRRAKIYAELTGFGASSDGYHITSPDPTGAGASLAIKAALNRAKLNPEDIGYINTHGTSTIVGDLAELAAIRMAFAGKIQGLSVSSTKSITGHLLGAAAGVEAVYSIMALNTGIIPPTANLYDIDDEAKDFDLTPLTAREKPLQNVLSNSFGFGGTNASLLFSKV